MLTIRMQRTGRKGLANFRVVVQDSQFSPNSGRVVAQLGHYNPHTKETVLDKEKAAEYLKNGAQPSPRVVKLLEDEKVKLPDWVKKTSKTSKRSVKNPEKLRKNQPKEEVIAEEIKEEIAEIKDEIIAEEISEVIVEEEAIAEVEAEQAETEDKPAEA